MRTLVSASLAAASIALAVPATAATPKANGKTEAGVKKICRMIERTGTRFQDRICLTTEQWKKVDRLVAG